MKEIVVVSHGLFAQGLIDSAKVILGGMFEAKYCCLKQDMGVAEFKIQIQSIVKSIEPSSQIIILADLKGGSPYTTTLSVLDEEDSLGRALIFTGVNLPLLLNIALQDDILKDEMDELISESRKGLDKFEFILEEDDEL